MATGFFAQTGGKSVSWADKKIGDSVTGTIVAVGTPEQQTAYKTGELLFDKKGRPKMQIRIDLQTTQRDPDDADDDGVRSLYVKGWMTGAIGDALKKAGVDGDPEVGGKLSVTLTERVPTDFGDPYNKFAADYVKAPSGLFNGDAAAAPSAAGDEPKRPAQITKEAWDQMPLVTRKAVASTMGGDEPPF